jgi:1-phosphofructokinase family hexose kinase
VILAAGLSPAWQQIVVLDRLTVGEVNRAREVHWCASGKVLNVGLALKQLASTPPLNKGGPGTPSSLPLRKGGPGGGATELEPQNSVSELDVRTLALVGGETGTAIRREFDQLTVPSRWIETQAPTRVCTSILDTTNGRTTELVENAPPITPAELLQFQHAYLEEVRQADLVVLAGSFPAGVPATFYRDLMAVTRGRAIVDAQREPLLAALEQRPFVVKPNREELGNTLGRKLESDAQLRDAMRELCLRGATWVVVSAGKERVWICSEESFLCVEPPTVDAINPIGCGDCLAAGIAVGLARGVDLPDAVLYGVAAAAENATQLLPARLDPERVAARNGALELSSDPDIPGVKK